MGTWALVTVLFTFSLQRGMNGARPSSWGSLVVSCYLSSQAVSRPTLFPLCAARSQCSRARSLPPNLGCLPTILARLGSEPPILEISKQNKGMQGPQGSLCVATPQALSSLAPVPTQNNQVIYEVEGLVWAKAAQGLPLGPEDAG